MAVLTTLTRHGDGILSSFTPHVILVNPGHQLSHTLVLATVKAHTSLGIGARKLSKKRIYFSSP